MSAKLSTLRPCRKGRCRKENKEKRSAWVAKSRLARNRVSVTDHPSPTVPSSSLSQSSGDLTANCSTPGIPMRTTSDYQVWHTDTHPNSSTGNAIARSKKVSPSQFGCTAWQCRAYGESLHIRTTETWSSKG